MKSLFRGIAISVLTLACGLSAFFISKWFNPDLEPFDQVKINALPTTPYCELRRHPKDFDGKVLRIDAKLYWFDHGYFLFDSDCSEATDAKYLDSNRTAISFEKTRSGELLDFLDKLQSDEQRFHGLHIIAVGRFTYHVTSLGRHSDAIGDRTPYNFELLSIEQATPEADEGD